MQGSMLIVGVRIHLAVYFHIQAAKEAEVMLSLSLSLSLFFSVLGLNSGPTP
jgi:hypothetical protein